MSETWRVLKFGGTSVSTVDCWQSILQIIQGHLQNPGRILVVCSAAAGVSNLLEHAIMAAKINSHEDSFIKIQDTMSALCLQCDIDPIIYQADLTALKNKLDGIALLSEITCRVTAEVMSAGELMLTKVGEQFLKSHGIPVALISATQYLRTVEESTDHLNRQYLSGTCDAEYDQSMRDELIKYPQRVLLTQGFLAANKHGETVLLGRGGSDVSAAYFSAKLAASVCEIWTDVPGIFTANPHVIPQARLNEALDYAEAQEIAAMGGSVLHPRTIQPLQAAAIPLRIAQTTSPDKHGTWVSAQGDSTVSRVKAVLFKKSVILILIEGVNMWQAVGFLADISTVFKKNGLSIDLISTSEACVTVSLDPQSSCVSESDLNQVLVDLNKFSRASLIGPCSAVSLVGSGIRRMLASLSTVFSSFGENRIHLMSQAANDLNLTVVVDECQAMRLVSKFHAALIESQLPGVFGLPWSEESVCMPDEYKSAWWYQQRSRLLSLASQSKPMYVYNEKMIESAIHNLLSCDSVDQFFYAMKANSSANILTIIERLGFGFECVSLSEIKLCLSLFPDINRKRILFTPNFAPRSEYVEALACQVNVTVDNLFVLENWPDVFRNKEILFRLDTGVGRGHHQHVMTAGEGAKFGLDPSLIQQTLALVKQSGAIVIGLHAHVGSGILHADNWIGVAKQLSEWLPYFPAVRFIDVGGGLGVPDKPGDPALDLIALNQYLSLFKNSFPDISLWMEPGRFVVADSGVLLARVSQIKEKRGQIFVGIETGMNSLIRPALYGAYHSIVNLSKIDHAYDQHVHIVGPICETADVLGYSRAFPKSSEGDVICIAQTGAYGAVMSTNYNQRQPAGEIMLSSIPELEKQSAIN